MSTTARHLDRLRDARLRISLACVGIGMLLVAGSAFAQAPMPSSRTIGSIPDSVSLPPSPTPDEIATAQAYDDLAWTGRRAAAPVVRKEARAALSAGRRQCNQLRQAERPECLRLVQQDYQEMMGRLQARR